MPVARPFRNRDEPVDPPGPDALGHSRTFERRSRASERLISSVRSPRLRDFVSRVQTTGLKEPAESVMTGLDVSEP